MSAAVEVRGATKTYGDVPALDGVDLTVQPGAVHGLLGPNGAGKSTLLRLLLGLVRPDRGDVQVLGAPAAPARDGVAGFADTPRSWPHLTGRRTLQLLARLDGGHAAHRVDEVLEQVGLAACARTRTAGWSTGQRQRLGLAGALLRSPRLLVVDEPTSGLDPAGVQDVQDLLRGLAAAGTTVLMSSHDLPEVAALCRDVTVVARGTVRFSGPLTGLADDRAAPRRLRTSDDSLALHLAGGLAVRDDAGLLVTADLAALDTYVLRLGAAGVAVRVLEPAADPLRAAFSRLTA